MCKEECKCDRCIHYVTSGVLNDDVLNTVYKFSCELGYINCDEHFEEETDDEEI